MTRIQGTKLLNFDADLQIIDITIGGGAEVVEGARITAHYTDALCKDGTIFRSSHHSGELATFGLNR